MIENVLDCGIVILVGRTAHQLFVLVGCLLLLLFHETLATRHDADIAAAAVAVASDFEVAGAEVDEVAATAAGDEMGSQVGGKIVVENAAVDFEIDTANAVAGTAAAAVVDVVAANIVAVVAAVDIDVDVVVG